MRLVQVLIPEGSRNAVLEILDAESIDYAVCDETGRGDFEALVSFPVPASGVEPVLAELYDVGIKEDSYTIVVPTETVISERIAALEARYSGYRISREELDARATELAPASTTFFIFLIVSTLIATTGLLLDSAATIIGAMVIAPLMGPAISASVGTVLADSDMASRGVTLQVAGLLATVGTAVVLGVVLRGTVLLPPVDVTAIPAVTERTSPNFLSLFLALGSGIAGAVSVMRGAGSTLVGVAIAVALIPPAATAGLGIAWGVPEVAIAGGVLVVVNMLAINLSALIIFWLAGYRPETGAHVARARRAVQVRIASIVFGIVLLTVVLGAVTLASFAVGTVETTANTEVESMVDEGEIGDLAFESVTVDYEIHDVLLDDPADVTVVLEEDDDSDIPPDVADRIDDRLTSETGEEVVVDVQFVRGQRSA